MFVPIFKKFFYVSHQPLRKEKDCLNCGTEVPVRFCPVCGQENIVTHQNFLSLTQHFIFDILHFDGKFFHTLLYIFTRPGYVAKQYVQGRRISYLDPIRMYLFTSALFFLVFFSVNKIESHRNKPTAERLTNEDRRELAQTYRERLEKKPADTVLPKRIALLLDTTKPVNIDSLGWREKIFDFDGKEFSSVEDYEAQQASLAGTEKDGWLKRLFTKQLIKLNQRYEESGDEATTILVETFLHKLPYLLFVSLPFFALVLKLLYQRRKQFFYSDHAVFTLYHYIFSFMLLLLVFGAVALKSRTGSGLFTFLLTVLLFSWPVYLYIEMKRFYGQGSAKTLGKFLLLNLAGFFILILLFVVFFLFSIFQL